MLTEGPCLVHYAKVKEKLVTIDASTTAPDLHLEKTR